MIGARAVAMKMGQQRRLLAVGDMPPTVDHDIDMRGLSWYRAIMRRFGTLLSTGDDVHARGRPRARWAANSSRS